MLPGFETLYLITQLHGETSLLHEHTDKWRSWTFHSVTGIFF